MRMHADFEGTKVKKRTTGYLALALCITSTDKTVGHYLMGEGSVVGRCRLILIHYCQKDKIGHFFSLIFFPNLELQKGATFLVNGTDSLHSGSVKSPLKIPFPF